MRICRRTECPGWIESDSGSLAHDNPRFKLSIQTVNIAVYCIRSLVNAQVYHVPNGQFDSRSVNSMASQ